MSTQVQAANPLQIVILGFVIFCLSSMAYLYNAFFTQFPGNDYMTLVIFLPSIFLGLCYVGYELMYGSGQLPIRFIKETALYLFTAVMIIYATNAIQYTPFSPIDHTIVKIEHRLHIHLTTLVNWTNQHPDLKNFLKYAYDSLPPQLFLLPICLLIMRRYAYVHEFCYLLLMTCLLGFTFYYFFPTTAPASILHNAEFDPMQQATQLKFWQIHNHIVPSTTDGGMISMPSFHIIWAWLCTYMVRFSTPFFYTLLIYNSCLTIACVLLGWHYPLDLLGSVITVLMAHWFFNQWNRA